MCVRTRSCLTLSDPVDYSPPGSSVHGIFKARILEQVAISYSRDIPDPGIKPVSLALYIFPLKVTLPGQLVMTGNVPPRNND